MNATLSIVGRAEPLDLERLSRMRRDELDRLHQSLYRCAVPAGNSKLAQRKIAWHLQASREGGLPKSARQQALAIAQKMRTRVRATDNLERRRGGLPLQHAVTIGIVTSHDSRIPMPGSVIVREYRGQDLVVHVLDSGFEYAGKRFVSLSALAKAITGTKWNGFLFFGLTKGKPNGR